MTEDRFKDQLMHVLFREYQSVWIVELKSRIVRLYWINETDTALKVKGAIEKINEVVDRISDYDHIRSWYTDHFIDERLRKRVYDQTDLDVVLKMTEEGSAYFVNYGRVVYDTENYNQLCYDRLRNENGETEYVFFATRDIDRMRKADIDSVTGLLTRTAFLKHAGDYLKFNPDKQIDVIISDIVDFKKINEVYGVQTADRVLTWLGSYLAPLMSENMIIGRYGGDQMVMLGAHEEMAPFTRGNNSADAWYEAVKRNGLPNIVNKFGVYENVPHDASVLAICDKAHIALSTIKNDYKKDIAFYDETIEKKLISRRRIEELMYSALQNEEFKVYYQPKHDATTGKLTGAEALVRWENPEFGFMSPGDFIPLFELNGFIVEVDYFVWKTTCMNLKKWREKGLKIVPVSVNASKLTFAQNDLVEKYLAAAKENEISSDLLHIEITETLMSSDTENLISKLNEFRKLGFGIELDDFGTGYSSLNILSTLPIDVVKLDMSFMKQFGNEKRTKVLAACVDLARELGYKTISEGVERPEQSDMLCKLGVDSIQGYLYSQPLSEEDFEDYIKENSMLI